MRIELNTIDEFCEEIEADAERIWHRIVRVRIDRTPQQEEEISFDVELWATALVKAEDGDYVLECGKWCGVDTRKESTGTQKANELRAVIKSVSTSNGLQVRPGKIEVY